MSRLGVWLAIAAIGCVGCRMPETGDAQPTVSFEVIDENGAVRCAGQVIATLQVSLKGSPVGCQLRGGRDSLQIHVALDGVDVDPAATVAAPTVTMAIDDVAVSNPPVLVPDAPSSDTSTRRTFTSRKWAAPPTTSGDLSLDVTVAQGYAASVTGLSVALAKAPEVTLRKAGKSCKEACTARNDVGTATFAITGWYPPSTAVHVESVVDSSVVTVVAPDPTFKATQRGPSATEVTLPVPAVGVHWKISAQVDGAAAKTFPVALAPAVLDLSLPSSPCVLDVGATVPFEVGAPAGMAATVAIVRFRMDDALAGAPAEQSLRLDPDEHVSGSFVAPPNPGMLSVTLFIGEVASTEVTCKVQTP